MINQEVLQILANEDSIPLIVQGKKDLLKRHLEEGKLDQREMAELTGLSIDQVKKARQQFKAQGNKEQKNLEYFQSLNEEEQFKLVQWYLAKHPRDHITAQAENHKQLHWFRFSSRESPKSEYSEHYGGLKSRFQLELFHDLLQVAFGEVRFGFYYLVKHIYTLDSEIVFQVLKEGGVGKITSCLSGEQTLRIMVYLKMGINEKRKLGQILKDLLGFQLLASDREVKQAKAHSLRDNPQIVMKDPIMVNNHEVSWWEKDLQKFIEYYLNHYEIPYPLEPALVTVDLFVDKGSTTTKVLGKIEEHTSPLAHIRANDNYENLKATFLPSLETQVVTLQEKYLYEVSTECGNTVYAIIPSFSEIDFISDNEGIYGVIIDRQSIVDFLDKSRTDRIPVHRFVRENGSRI